MQGSKPQRLTMNLNINLNEQTPRLTHKLHTEFRHAIGRLKYLSGGT
jgi:hypothetical protein